MKVTHIFQVQAVRFILCFIAWAIPLSWLFLNHSTSRMSNDALIRLILCLTGAFLVSLRRRRQDEEAPRPSRHPAYTQLFLFLFSGSILLALSWSFPIVRWPSLVALFAGVLTSSMPNYLAGNARAAALLLFFASPLPVSLTLPLTDFMQQASVLGTEWILHLMGYGVWADGQTLTNGSQFFSVPLVCSGFTTASIVALLALAIGLLRRLNPFETAIFLVLAFLTALAVNIGRISLLILFQDTFSLSSDFLHESGDILAAFVVLLVYVEILIIEHLRHRRREWQNKLLAARQGALSQLPPFWHQLINRYAALFVIMPIALLIAYAAYRTRPQARQQLRRIVASRLSNQGYYARALTLALNPAKVGPLDNERQMMLIRLYILNQTPEPVLPLLDQYSQPEEFEDKLELALLRAHAQTQINPNQQLPELIQQVLDTQSPAVAAALADLAWRRHDIPMLVRQIPVAMRDPANETRLQRFIPLLFRHGQWPAIEQLAPDPVALITNPVLFFHATTAKLHLGQSADAARAVKAAIQRYPDHPRTLQLLMPLALTDPDSWDADFASLHINQARQKQSISHTRSMTQYAFLMMRPDLVWHLYRQIVSRDQALANAIATPYQNYWHLFRRQHLSLSSETAFNAFDMSSWLALADALSLFGAIRRNIPTVPHSTNPIPPPSFASPSLADWFSQLPETLPKTSKHLLPLQTAQREAATTKIRQYIDSGHLVAAELLVDELLRSLPFDPIARTAVGAIKLTLGQAEAALHILQQTPNRQRIALTDELETQALLQTQRYNEVPLFRRRRLAAPIQIPPSPPQRSTVPAAELTLQHAPFTTSPLSLPTPRNPIEQAQAQYAEAYSAYQQNELTATRDHLEAALASWPYSPTIWHSYARFSSAPSNVIQRALESCPDDPTLLLMNLIILSTTERTQLELAAQRLLTSPQSDIATLTRAVIYLRRIGHPRIAAPLAAAIDNQERHYLPACRLGVQIAVESGRPFDVLRQTAKAIAASVQPIPELYAQFVRNKSQDTNTGIPLDSDMLNALRQLRDLDPDNTFWDYLMGVIRFQRGAVDLIDTNLAMTRALQRGNTNRVVAIIAAETARQLNRPDRAVEILRQALQRTPGNLTLVNNLAWLLAQDASTLPQALELIPQLEPYIEQSAEIRDTIITILLKSGNHADARPHISHLIRTQPPDTIIWFRSQRHMAEILWRQGNTKLAASTLQQLLRGSRNMPDEEVLIANQLLADILADLL